MLNLLLLLEPRHGENVRHPQTLLEYQHNSLPNQTPVFIFSFLIGLENPFLIINLWHCLDELC